MGNGPSFSVTNPGRGHHCRVNKVPSDETLVTVGSEMLARKQGYTDNILSSKVVWLSITVLVLTTGFKCFFTFFPLEREAFGVEVLELLYILCSTLASLADSSCSSVRIKSSARTDPVETGAVEVVAMGSCSVPALLVAVCTEP